MLALLCNPRFDLSSEWTAGVMGASRGNSRSFVSVHVLLHLLRTGAHLIRTYVCVGMLMCEHSSAADGGSHTEDPKQSTSLPHIWIEGRKMELWHGMPEGTLRDERRAREAAGVRTQAACPCHNTRAAIARALASVSQAFLRA